MQGDYNKALEFVEKGLEVSPREPVLYYNKANILVKLKDFQEARLYYTRARFFDKGNATIQNNKGIALLRLKKPLKAVEKFKKAISLDSNLH
mmetsp:Transcript_4862/g.4061  ORF Transcript_4862/g.4061 Transcript_4862/m.4061 type:complete len:92 (-) Transcript_4862:1857-2132(-)